MPPSDESILERLARGNASDLHRTDATLHDLLVDDWEFQSRTLMLVAAASIALPSVVAAASTSARNITGEGYPGARMHAGCAVVDRIETLAIERARKAFGALYANVQPHSTSTANQALIFSLLSPGDTLMGMRLDCGGHLTHGAKASVVGRTFDVVSYGLGRDERLDFDQIRRLARERRPRLIICGASSYPRQIDFARFREIADEVEAYLLADVSHVAGLIVAGQHPSPIDHAHFTTLSTYKQLCGPRGGLILMGPDAERRLPSGKTLSETVQRSIFPFFQGTPDPSAIAAKAAALAHVTGADFRQVAERIVRNASALAESLDRLGYRLVTGGTDTHMVLVDLSEEGIDGARVERSLERCGVLVNRNVVPGDRRSPNTPTGVRLGVNCLTMRGMGEAEMTECAELFDLAVRHSGTREEELLPPEVQTRVRHSVEELCTRFPLPGALHPTDAAEARAGR